MARQAGVRAAELGLAGDSVWIDDSGIPRPGATTADDVLRLARDDYDKQLKASDANVDQLRREIIDKTNENRALITQIRGLEQGLKEIHEQLKGKRFQRPTNAGDQSSYTIQCPSLEKMLQVNQKIFSFLFHFGFLNIGFGNSITCWSIRWCHGS